MKVKIKLEKGAIMPSYAKKGDAGMDLTALTVNFEEKYIEYGTGIYVKIPEGYVGLLFPRSSISNKELILKNSVGIIDSGYIGEIKLRFQDVSEVYMDSYKVGDRIGQLIIMPFPKIEFEEVSELTTTERGKGGFGSTNITSSNNSMFSTLTNKI